MNLLFAPGANLFWTSCAIASPALLIAAITAPWRMLLTESLRQHAFFAAILGLAIVWLLQVSVWSAIAIHPLMMIVTTMVFGWSFALLIGGGALVVLEIFQLTLRTANMDWDMALAQFDLRTFPVDFVLSVLVPASWAWLMIWLVDHWKFKNPFTYFWGVGFFGAMISCSLIGACSWLLFYITGSEIQLEAVREHFWIFVLLTFPEGFLNGILATVMTVFYPELVKTYRDDWYTRD